MGIAIVNGQTIESDEYDELVTILKGGEYLRAIKRLKDTTGLGLRECKEIVDEIKETF